MSVSDQNDKDMIEGIPTRHQGHISDDVLLFKVIKDKKDYSSKSDVLLVRDTISQNTNEICIRTDTRKHLVEKVLFNEKSISFTNDPEAKIKLSVDSAK